MNNKHITNWEELPNQVQERWQQQVANLILPPLTFNGRDQVSPEERLAAIYRDPALCAKVLAVANSATQGRQTPANSIEQAVIQLGQNMLQIIMYGYYMESVLGRFPNFPREHFNFVRNWSAYASITAFHLSAAAGLLNRDIVSTATLVARLGSLALGLTWPAPDNSYFQIVDENQRYFLEMQKWGISTPVMGQRIAEHWGFPEPLPSFIQRQETPLFTDMTNSEEDKSVLVMCLSSTVSAAFMLDPTSDPVKTLSEGYYFKLKQNLVDVGLLEVLRSTWDSKILVREIESIKASF